MHLCICLRVPVGKAEAERAASHTRDAQLWPEQRLHRVHMHLCMFTYACIPMHVYLCMYTYACIPMHVYLCMYTSTMAGTTPSQSALPSHAYLPRYSSQRCSLRLLETPDPPPHRSFDRGYHVRNKAINDGAFCPPHRGGKVTSYFLLLTSYFLLPTSEQ